MAVSAGCFWLYFLAFATIGIQVWPVTAELLVELKPLHALRRLQSSVVGTPMVPLPAPSNSTASGPSQTPALDSNVAIYIYVFFGGMCGVGTLALLGYCYHQRRLRRFVDSDNLNNNMQRYTLVDSFLDAGLAEWMCSICYHENHPAKKECVMCGAPQVITENSATDQNRNRQTSGRLDRQISGLFEGSGAGATQISSAAANGVDMAARQRSLHVRRLNMHTLTQRQRGARRRTIWRRVAADDGQLRWVRFEPGPTSRVSVLQGSGSTEPTGDYVSADSPSSRGESNATNGDTSKRKDLKRGASQDFTSQGMQVSVGFVRQVDEKGNVNWVTADQVKVGEIVQLEDDEVPPHRAIVDVEEIMAKPFRTKLRWFLEELEHVGVPWEEGHLLLKIRREAVLQESMHLLMLVPASDLRQRLRIEFIDEPGLDAGGLMREWFLLLCNQLFDESLGLFQRTEAENVGYYINPASGAVCADHLKYFQFVGRLIAKALLEGQVFTAHFALPLFKHLLGVPISFSDLEFLDEELYRNCMYIADNEGVESLSLDFSVQRLDAPGVVTTIDLKPDGRNIEVTDENKFEYLNLLLKYRMLDSINDQVSALIKGLYEVLPQSLLVVFDYQELELLLCGVPEIDVDDWEAHTDVKYRDMDKGTKQEKRVVKWFWEVLRSWSQPERAKLLQFVTGTSRVPIEGFKALVSNDGRIRRFNLHVVPKGIPPAGLFPKAHTCFNRLDVPLYDSKEDLETYLSLVVNMEITGFSMQ